MKKIYYNESGWVCKRYPYNIPIEDENRYIEVEDDGETYYAPQYHAWRVVDGKLDLQQYEVKQWTEAERTAERKRLHEATDNDYAKYARQVRCNIDLEHSQAVLDYIDQYNIAVSDTVNQPNYPQEVSYPKYVPP